MVPTYYVDNHPLPLRTDCTNCRRSLAECQRSSYACCATCAVEQTHLLIEVR